MSAINPNPDPNQGGGAGGGSGTPGAGTGATPTVEQQLAVMAETLKKIEARNEELERKLSERREAKPEPKPGTGAPKPDTGTGTGDKPPVEPNVIDFADYNEYRKAERKYLTDFARFEAKQDRAREREQERSQDAYNVFQGRLAKEAKVDRDIMHKATVVGDLITAPMGQAIQESDFGPQLVRHLYDNQDEAARLRGLSHASAIRELGRLEDQIAAKEKGTKKTVSGAPEPAPNLSGTGGAPADDDDKLSTDEWIARENKRQFGY